MSQVGSLYALDWSPLVQAHDHEAAPKKSGLNISFYGSAIDTATIHVDDLYLPFHFR